MIKTLNPIISIIRTDAVMVQNAIWTPEEQFGLKKKTFEMPNLKQRQEGMLKTFLKTNILAKIFLK